MNGERDDGQNPGFVHFTQRLGMIDGPVESRPVTIRGADISWWHPDEQYPREDNTAIHLRHEPSMIIVIESMEEVEAQIVRSERF